MLLNNHQNQGTWMWKNRFSLFITKDWRLTPIHRCTNWLQQCNISVQYIHLLYVKELRVFPPLASLNAALHLVLLFILLLFIVIVLLLQFLKTADHFERPGRGVENFKQNNYLGTCPVHREIMPYIYIADSSVLFLGFHLIRLTSLCHRLQCKRLPRT